MTASAKMKQTLLSEENLVQHGAITLEFIRHNDINTEVDQTKKKVQDILTQIYVRAKKRGRPRDEEEKEVA